MESLLHSRFVRRLRIAWACRTWPWRVPAIVVETVGMKRPPEAVFEAFRKLHGIEDES